MTLFSLRSYNLFVLDSYYSLLYFYQKRLSYGRAFKSRYGHVTFKVNQRVKVTECCAVHRSHYNQSSVMVALDTGGGGVQYSGNSSRQQLNLFTTYLQPSHFSFTRCLCAQKTLLEISPGTLTLVLV